MKIKLYNALLIIVAVGIAFLLIVNPFKTSDLDRWNEDVSVQDYLSAVSLLEQTLDNPRNSYFNYAKNINLKYDLPSVDAEIVSGETSDTLGYNGRYVADLSTGQFAEYELEVLEAGYYTIDTDYIVTGTILNNITISIQVNDTYLFSDAKIIDVPLLWEDQSKEFDVDTYGDESLPLQRKIETWTPLHMYNNTYTINTPLLFYFSAGPNTIRIDNVSSGDLKLGEVSINPPRYIPLYDDYITMQNHSIDTAPMVDIEPINATDYVNKNSSFVRLMAFGDPSVTPFDNVYKKLNVIDGNAWNKAGQEVSYEITVPETGFYDLTIHFANYKTDFDVFRSIRIDGEIPFQEFASYQIPYTPTNWDNHTMQRADGTPYKVYLTAGESHTITLRAEKSELSRQLHDIQLMIDHINQFALEIIKITGKDIDRDRTWELTKYIPDTEAYLEAYTTIVKYQVIELSEYSEKEDLSATLSYLKMAVVEFEKMLEKPDDLPLYLNNLYSGSSSVTLLLGDSLETLSNQQLYLDVLYISNTGDYGRASASIFTRVLSNITSFISSYTSDKFDIENDEDAIDVWTNRPITYVDIMQKMADRAYDNGQLPQKVKISVMPDASKLILANSAGKTPDVALGLSSFMPYDMAIRGAVQDLSEFDDFWEYAGGMYNGVEEDYSTFAPGALVPYILDDGVYAIPETLEFHALVYRKDVFHALELEVPDTWDDVIGLLPTLQRYDMNFYYPTSGGTSLKWFYQTTPFIFQNGGSLYSEDGLTTVINSEESVEGLQMLGEFYTTHSLPEQVPLFYNSFRYNQLPVGIVDFNTYMQLKNAAPELVGQWALAPYPGIENESGDVERWYVGNGSGGLMFKNSDHKEEAWEFMKWWMSTATQTEFAQTLQATYGPEFLWLSGNVNAVVNSPISIEDKQIIIEQIQWLRDVPRTPGQYMLERGLSDIWNAVTFDGVPTRVAIDRQVIIINREIKRKMIEFGYLDYEGNILKDYVIRDVDWIKEQMEQALSQAGDVE